MILKAEPLERRLQFAGVLLILGLFIEALSVIWNRPVAFVVFVSLGGLLFAAGMLLYLYSLVSVKAAPSKQ
jgi:hypothetical protein